MKNHLGSYECKLCLTLHNNEGSYLAHTQGRRHQQNLARRAARDSMPTAPLASAPCVSLVLTLTACSTMPTSVISKPKVRKTIKIGRPGYKVVKEKDSETNQLSLTFFIDYPEIDGNVKPRYRFMSAFEQKVEVPDKNYQYLLFAAEPYETIAFKVPNRDIEKSTGPQIPGESKVSLLWAISYIFQFWTKWDENMKQFSLQLHFKPAKKITIVETTGRRYDPMQPKKEEAPLQDPRANYAYFNK